MSPWPRRPAFPRVAASRGPEAGAKGNGGGSTPGFISSGRQAAFEAALQARIAKQTAWWQEFPLSSEAADWGARFSSLEQAAFEREADECLAGLQHRLEGYPDGPAARAQWRDRFFAQLDQFAAGVLGFPGACRQILFSGPYRRATTEFVRQTRAFDPKVEIETLFQALRNVWIANSLQLFLERGISLSPAVFAYSLLYPYTDNFLDDEQQSVSAKQAMGEWLGRRLHGAPVTAAGSPAREILRLVEMIEETYPPRAFPEVQLSLCAIHRAQMRSLEQQDSGAALGEAEVLRISIAKGGASVLADGYLVAGRLSDAEADFCFGYGVLLQLLDDLQDLQPDVAAGQATLFSRRAATGPLDGLVERLHGFLRDLVWASPAFAGERFSPLKELIASSCAMSLLNGVAVNAEYFSAGYVRRLEEHSRFRFGYVRERRQTLAKQYCKAKERLERQRGLDSVLSVLE